MINPYLTENFTILFTRDEHNRSPGQHGPRKLSFPRPFYLSRVAATWITFTDLGSESFFLNAILAQFCLPFSNNNSFIFPHVLNDYHD